MSDVLSAGCDEPRKHHPVLLLQNILDRCFCGNGIDRKGYKVSSNARNATGRHPGLLHNLLDLCLGGNGIGKKGCKALRALMNNPACKIQLLDLRDNDLDDECMTVLIDGLVTNRSIRMLNIENQDCVTTRGWRILTDALSKRHVTIEDLRLGNNDIDDGFAIALGASLTTNKSLTNVDLTSSNNITSIGWRGFVNCLRSPGCGLEGLNISGCNINDQGLDVISAALTINKSLKRLNMSDNKNISSYGWIACFHSLMDSEVRLEALNLSRNGIDDLVSGELIILLAKIGTVQSLCLCGMTGVSTNGLCMFANLLRPNSGLRLKELRIGISYPLRRTNKLFYFFVEALANNTCLESLMMCGFDMPDDGEVMLTQILCNTSSIAATYHSNHTLREFICTPSECLPREVKVLLKANEHTNKADVARWKIVARHFNDVECSIRIFDSMSAPMLPNALSLFCRDSCRYAMVNQLLQSMPWLIESAVKVQSSRY